MRRKFIFSIWQYTTTFLAEVHAIRVCILGDKNRNYNNRNIYTKLDSQAALQALEFSRLTQN
jgi:hypothetical protein